MDVTDKPLAVLWDMDGTILDSEVLWDVAMAEFSERQGITMTEELRKSTLGNSMTGALTKIYVAASVAPADRDYPTDSAWLTSRVAELFDQGIPWRPGARDVLDALADAEIPIALVTNTDRPLAEHAMGTIGRDRFAFTVCGDEVPDGKPAPDLYLTAAAALGIAPRMCLAVEDSPTGTASATAAGCPTLVVPSADADVPDGPGRTFATTLESTTVDDLAAAWRSARETLNTREEGTREDIR